MGEGCGGGGVLEFLEMGGYPKRGVVVEMGGLKPSTNYVEKGGSRNKWVKL